MIKDINKIISATVKESAFEMIILVDGYQFKPIRLMELDISNDYVNKISPTITVMFMLQQDTVSNYIAPNKNNIEVILKDISYDTIQKYKLFLEPLSLDTENNGVVSESNVTTVKGQLVDVNEIKFRATIVSGVFSSTVDRLLPALISTTLSMFEKKYPMKIAPVDNNEEFNQLVLPSGTLTYRLPDILQEMVGVYNGGIGYYKDYYGYYIYSLYDIDKGFSKPYKLHIFASDDKRHNIGGGSFVVDNDIILIATVKPEHSEDNDYALSTLGCSVVSNSSGDIMGRPLDNGMEPKEIKANIRLKETNTVGETINVGNTRNLYKSRKNIMLRNGTYVSIKWVNSNHRVLHPMMSLVYTYKYNGKNVTRKGILHAFHTVFDMNNSVELTYLTIFVETDFNKKQNTVTEL